MNRRSYIIAASIAVSAGLLFLGHWTVQYTKKIRDYAADQQRVSDILKEAANLHVLGSFDEETELLAEAKGIAKRWSGNGNYFDDAAIRVENATERARAAKQAAWNNAFDGQLLPRTDVKHLHYRIISRETQEVRRTTRMIVRVAVPLGREMEQLVDTLRVAARDAYLEFFPDQVIVFAYRPFDSGNEYYTAGKAEINLDTDGSATGFPGLPVFSYDTSELYFKGDPADLYPVGSDWILDARDGSTRLSHVPDRWDHLSLSKVLTNGSAVKVIAVQVFPAGGREDIIRVLVEVVSASTSDGRSRAGRGGWIPVRGHPAEAGDRGWLHADDLKPM